MRRNRINIVELELDETLADSAGCYEKSFFDFFEVITVKKVIPKMV